jgi:predicted TIM-barrel fold metal-dependent hydrolase
MYCDSHVHIVGDVARYPQYPADRPYTAAPAALADLRRLGAARGIERFVIVQPSFYESDNRLLLETLAALGENGRGVAVVDTDASREQLADAARRGVRGLRLNLYSRPGDSAAPLATVFGATAEAARRFDGHVEVIAPLTMILANAQLLRGAAVPVVIDHYGLYGDTAPTSAAGRDLLALLALPHVWIKLSAPYRNGGGPLNMTPDAAWLAAILEAAAARCVWGSDWPHTPPQEQQTGNAIPLPYRPLRYGDIVDGFLRALPSAELAERIMEANPARLYGFAD